MLLTLHLGNSINTWMTNLLLSYQHNTNIAVLPSKHSSSMWHREALNKHPAQHKQDISHYSLLCVTLAYLPVSNS